MATTATKIVDELREVDSQIEQAREAFDKSVSLSIQNDYAVACILRALGGLRSAVHHLAEQVEAIDGVVYDVTSQHI